MNAPASGLVRYEAARAALAEACRIDEVMDVRDRAKAMEIYAKQAKETFFLDRATDLRMRAERRAGEMLRSMEKAKGGEQYHKDNTSSVREPVPTLASVGVTKKESFNWQKLAALRESEFEMRVEQAKRQANAAIEMTAAERAVAKKERRAEREAELAAKIKSLPDKRYGVILADPPWRFEPYSEKGMDRAADNHYPTATIDEIKALDVASITANDCVLFLWATAPMLAAAIEVMAHWGFTYRSNYVWDKITRATGYWSANVHEHLLIGTRGAPVAPAQGTQWESIQDEAAREHSAKPEWSYAMIETYFPNLPRMELNARKRRDGWDAWGNEAPAEAGAVDSGD